MKQILKGGLFTHIEGLNIPNNCYTQFCEFVYCIFAPTTILLREYIQSEILCLEAPRSLMG